LAAGKEQPRESACTDKREPGSAGLLSDAAGFGPLEDTASGDFEFIAI
jgi:hypothetical protein